MNTGIRHSIRASRGRGRRFFAQRVYTYEIPTTLQGGVDSLLTSLGLADGVAGNARVVARAGAYFLS